MHSRAYLLIKRDLYLLENNPVQGIDLEPTVDDNCFDLTFFFRPSKESIWSGCMFRIFCSFNDTFNVQPPSMHFDPNHIPYHPNVDPITGRISLTTNEKWTSRYTLRLLLDELVNAFITPNEKSIINSDAMRMWKYRPNDYRTIIEDSILKSQELMELIHEEKFAASQTPAILTKGKDANRARLRTPPQGARRQNSNLSLHHRVSFEDYLNTWKGIATSKASLHDENPLLQQLSTQPKLQAQHLALNANELARQLDDRAIQFERLKYGKLSADNRSRPRIPPSQTSVTDNTYSALVVTEANSRADIAPSYTHINSEEHAYTVDENNDDNHMKNDEVDELIEWTQALPATTDETILS